jgi:ferritin-like metal-binding protein YciE
MPEITNLRELFIFNVRRAYDAEQRIVKALPVMRDAASSAELRHAFQAHLEETELHVDRLLQVFEWFDEKAKTETCHAVKGLIKDSDYAALLTLIDDETPIKDVKDAALIAAAQQVEHVEIALYGTLRTWAITLDKRDAMEVIEVTLEEEKNADALLTGIAGTLNLRAAQAR